MELDVEVIGSGPRVLLVHGSILGRDTWRRQRALAEHWTLVIPDRPGFGASPPLERGDFESEAPLIAELLGEGAHLVGHSYGAVIALYAAALARERVRSLTVSEPGCLTVAAGDPLVDAQIAGGEVLFARASEMTPVQFLHAFRSGVGSTHGMPEHLDAHLARGVELLMRERPPWEADPPLEQLAAAPFPKLVISGGHSPVFERVCDLVAARSGARRATVAGRGHSIPACGDPYNTVLDAHLRSAPSPRAPSARD